MEINEIKQLHQLNNGEGGLYLVVRKCDDLEVIDLDSDEIIAILDSDKLSLEEIVKMLRVVWDFDVETQRKYFYFVTYGIFTHDTYGERKIYRENATIKMSEKIINSKGIEKLKEKIVAKFDKKPVIELTSLYLLN